MLHYDKVKYNCAHHAISRINEIHDTKIEIKDGDEWQIKFAYSLRKYFKKVSKPTNGCLCIMVNVDNSLHCGVFNNWMVEHNHEAGSVIMSDLGTIRSIYKKVRFYAINS